MRLRAEYRVEADLRFLGNLDMMHLMERTLRRAGISYHLSEGFNPHIKLSMGTVLPVGVWGKKEYFDLELADTDVNEFMCRMNSSLPPGIIINNCREIPPSSPSLMKVINAAQYGFVISDTGDEELEKVVTEILAQEKLVVQNRGKNKNQQKDLRPGIYDIKIEKTEEVTRLCITVSINEPLNVRFDELLDVIIRYGIKKELIIDFYRRENYIKEGSHYYSPLEKVK